MKARKTTILTVTSPVIRYDFYQQYDNLYLRIRWSWTVYKARIKDNKNPLSVIIRSLNSICGTTIDCDLEYINSEFLPYLLQELEDGRYKDSSAKKAIIEYAKEHKENKK